MTGVLAPPTARLPDLRSASSGWIRNDFSVVANPTGKIPSYGANNHC